MTRTLFAIALVAAVLAGIVYVTAPVWFTLWVLAGGLYLLDLETATAFRVIVFGPWVAVIGVVAVAVVVEVRDALAAA
jgi:hypothetical protein